MKHKYADVFEIIRYAISEVPATHTTKLPWDTVYSLAVEHQIVPLIAHGLHQMHVSKSVQDRFNCKAAENLYLDQNQLFSLEELEQAFQQAGVDYILLKGTSLKPLYPASEMRVMGDIDILIRLEQYHTVRSIMKDLGYSEGNETDHELPWMRSPSILVELHKSLIPSYNSDYYQYFADPWASAVKVEGKAHRYRLPLEMEYLYLLTHLAKHYRDGGIGIRQFLDLWIFRKAFPDMDTKRLKKGLSALQLDEFHENVLSALDAWFSEGKYDRNVMLVTDWVMQSGSFGNSENFAAAHASRAYSANKSISSAKRKTFLRLVFLPYASMKNKYRVLKKVPILLPFFWVIRWFSAITVHRKNIKDHVAKVTTINSETAKIYNEQLMRVGLRYDLKPQKN